ncbi:NAD-dependent epimerase/dehydratase family protein [Ktedonosporobacter rubrisoli]|uniref:NAD-dependent epimerase/dehydratase family protein n=1 Tax=Ktedonosporobacter rubrisoli TaxID=2509675 RepID=UPI001A9326D0|nr:NAD(P)-dependent oxidoreductase [Ktedonosporobacter rubrisoli]
MCELAQVSQAVEGQDIVIHLAAVIPPASLVDPERAYAVNVGGTRNLLEAAKRQSQPPKFFFTSTFDVFGHTQDKEPPRKLTDPVQATDAYSAHKIEGEEMVKSAGLDWAIFRFCDMPPILRAHKPHPIMFEIALETRFEMLHPADAALAIANGIAGPIWGETWLIGGGPRCQIRYRDYVQTMMERMCVGKLPESAFSQQQYCTDWLESEASEALLHYQRHSFEEMLEEMLKHNDPGLLISLSMPLLRPFVRRSILKLSPYVKAQVG